MILHIIIPQPRARARAQETFIPKDPPIYYVCIEETYAIIQQAHIATSHGGRDRMLKHHSLIMQT